ncbi:ATP-binding cassette subfamily C protein CydC [Alkalibacillus flavidus]|uniref:ATP-binding cassette subfamily C protein CydC n=1 Tax=Alkalibacillus flavidus TaxID=546021 RepID=A0ABV2KUT4_9BACI
MNGLQAVITQLMKEKRDVLISILFGFIAGIAAVGLFSASGYLISQAALGVPIYALTIVIATVKLLGFTRAGSRYVERLISHRATFSMLKHIRVHFFDRLQQLSPARLQRLKSGDLLSRAVNDVESLQNVFLRVIYPPIVLVLIFFATILFTAYFSVWMAIWLIIGLSLSLVILPALFAWLQSATDESTAEQASALTAEATDMLYGYQDLTIHQNMQARQDAFADLNDDYENAIARSRVRELVHQVLDGWVGFAMAWGVLAIGSYLSAAGQFDAVLLAMFMLLTLTVFENTSPMAAFPQYFRDNKQAADRLYTLDQPDEAGGNTLQTPITHIDFDHVTFTYPGEERATLHNVSLSVEPGSKTAIIGASGSGKTTVLQLLLKLEHVESGSIQLNGESIHTIQADSIWDVSNVVMQEDAFFQGTIRDNLLSDASDESLNEALRLAALDSFTLDDPVYEKGDNLSGGEKQRLALARVFLRDASLWLLDEPTSSLDRVTAERVLHHVYDRAQNDTLILVSHDLTGLDQFDQIIVMDHGEVVETGDYDSLMDKQGYLYQLKQIEAATL